MIVRRLLELDGIDRIIVTPAWLNPFKTHSLASPRQRLAWCRKLFDDPRVIVDPGEVEAARPVYTAHTIDRLGQTYDLKYIALGSDNLSAIETWYDFDRLNQTITWLVFEREGHTQGYEKLKHYRRFPLDAPISSSTIRSGKSIGAVDTKIAPDVQKILTKGSQ